MKSCQVFTASLCVRDTSSKGSSPPTGQRDPLRPTRQVDDHSSLPVAFPDPTMQRLPTHATTQNTSLPSPTVHSTVVAPRRPAIQPSRPIAEHASNVHRRSARSRPRSLAHDLSPTSSRPRAGARFAARSALRIGVAAPNGSASLHRMDLTALLRGAGREHLCRLTTSAVLTHSQRMRGVIFRIGAHSGM